MKTRANDERLAMSVDLFRTFSHPIRIRLINLLRFGDVCSCHVHKVLSISPSNATQQIRYLRKHGIIESKVVGKDEGKYLPNTIL